MYPHKTSPPSNEDSAYSSMHDDTESFVAAAMRTSQSHFAIPAILSPRNARSFSVKGLLQSSITTTTTGVAASSVSISAASGILFLRIWIGAASMPQHPTLFAASQSKHFMASTISEKPGSSGKDSVQSIKSMLDPSIGYAGQNLQIRVLGVFQQNAKSRVETQIKLCLQLVTAKREMKRSKKTDTMADGDFVFKLENEDDMMEQKLRKKIFGVQLLALVDFSSGGTILPSRITCYCRHHSEKSLDLAPGNAVPSRDRMFIPEPSPESFLSLSPPPFKRAFVRLSEDDDFAAALANTLIASLESGNTAPTPSLLPTPSIGRIIPSEGPMHGGIKITILGPRFHENLTV
ncbi:SPT3 Dosage dependent suppressor of Ty-induced promoter mutations-like protein [Phlyctochytrium planicorne]|nr:SPT3 Dosage dependent suppressor of Ty-induced promoter mutations-like protein [Phlyctochytrium planicorne]